MLRIGFSNGRARWDEYVPNENRRHDHLRTTQFDAHVEASHEDLEPENEARSSGWTEPEKTQGPRAFNQR